MAWINKHLGRRLQIKSGADSDRFDKSLAMYLIVRDLIKDMDAVGGGFMSQLEWGSDKRGKPLPVADCMESLFNATFDRRPLEQDQEVIIQRGRKGDVVDMVGIISAGEAVFVGDETLQAVSGIRSACQTGLNEAVSDLFPPESEDD